VRAVYTGVPPGTPPTGRPLETWELAAIGPTWHPEPGEHAVTPVDGVLEVHADGLVFRARDAADETTGSPLLAVIPVSTIRTIGPLSPGNPGTGGWMPGWQRRLRSPGFVVGTEAGGWVFDGPHGPKRADALSARFGIA
jgi:hypothetical protein